MFAADKKEDPPYRRVFQRKGCLNQLPKPLGSQICATPELLKILGQKRQKRKIRLTIAAIEGPFWLKNS